MSGRDLEAARVAGRRGLTTVAALDYVDALEREVTGLRLALAAQAALVETLEEVVRATAALRPDA